MPQNLHDTWTQTFKLTVIYSGKRTRKFHWKAKQFSDNVTHTWRISLITLIACCPGTVSRHPWSWLSRSETFRQRSTECPFPPVSTKFHVHEVLSMGNYQANCKDKNLSLKEQLPTWSNKRISSTRHTIKFEDTTILSITSNYFPRLYWKPIEIY